MFVDVFGINIRALFVFVQYLTKVTRPLHGCLVILCVITEIGDVNQSCDGILIGSIAMAVADVFLMFLIGTFKTVFCIIATIVGNSLTTTNVDEQVHVVAGGVTLQFFQPLCCRNGYLERTLIVAFHTEQICQSASGLSVDVEVFFGGGIANGFECSVPIELCHARLFHPVAGIAFPVVRLCLSQTSCFLKTVCEYYQPVEVSCFVDRFNHALSLGALFLTRSIGACRCQYDGHDD